MPKAVKNRDPNQWATTIVSTITGLPPPTGVLDEVRRLNNAEKNPAAVALGRLGGLKGGKARAATLTAKERQEISKKGADARWELQRRLEDALRGTPTLSVAQLVKRFGMTLAKAQLSRKRIVEKLKRESKAV